MDKPPVIIRKSLHGELVPLLRDLIIGGELLPGDKIPEQSLCERFGVSRTPLREALKVLAAEGLLQLSVNRGAMVARISAREIDELFPIMGAMEALAGELACARMTDDELMQVQKLHDEMVAHYQRQEWGPYIRLNRAIHDALVDFAGNLSLKNYYQSLMVRIHSVRYVAKKSAARWKQAVDEHEQLMAALHSRDRAKVAEILRMHLLHKAEMVHEALADAENQGNPASPMSAA